MESKQTNTVEASNQVAPDILEAQQKFGLSEAELSQTLSYRGHEATLLEVLGHKECPLGGAIEEAYKDGGREAVEAKVSLFGQISKEFVVVLDDQKKT
jgi:hypothetical protein